MRTHCSTFKLFYAGRDDSFAYKSGLDVARALKMWFCQLSIGRRFVHAYVVTCCLTELLVIGQLKVTIIHRFAQSKGHNYSIRCWLEQGLITFCPILKLSHLFRWLGRYGRYTGVYAPMYPFLDAPSRLCSCRKSRVELSSYWSRCTERLSERKH